MHHSVESFNQTTGQHLNEMSKANVQQEDLTAQLYATAALFNIPFTLTLALTLLWRLRWQKRNRIVTVTNNNKRPSKNLKKK